MQVLTMLTHSSLEPRGPCGPEGILDRSEISAQEALLFIVIITRSRGSAGGRGGGAVGEWGGGRKGNRKTDMTVRCTDGEKERREIQT